MIVSASKVPHGLSLPSIATVEEVAPHRARLTLEPFERGYGMTLGAALRRVLLSSLHGWRSGVMVVSEVRGTVPGAKVRLIAACNLRHATTASAV